MEQALTDLERPVLKEHVKSLIALMRPVIEPGDIIRIKNTLIRGEIENAYHRDPFGMHPLSLAVDTAIELCQSVSPDRSMVIAVLIQIAVNAGCMSIDEVRKTWDDDVANIVSKLLKVASLYERHATAESENFRRLLLAFAEDIRVIIIMIVARLAQMKAINHHPDEDKVRHVAYEAGYLYAPLAHRLGLYAIKSQLEDLSLKYTDRAVFTSIARKLNETKVKRDAYIANFIAPIKAKLEAEGLKFDIKGRTKSIYSIWNKMKKQKNDLEHIYDLFAIRIIIDAPLEREKPECWLAYSIVTDMYRPNPARMKDWISIPKTNGYESLHITVYGPDERWVEVQIRTRRMDEVAEKGLAAHWRYKGIKSEQGLDAWMKNVRDILETADTGPMELMKNLKLDVYNKEVFVFTPKGDLHRLPLGATVLDFAFNIHTGLGCKCTGGKVNGRNCKLNHKLQSGDTVEILTSNTQQPKRDWLNFVITGKARNKIRIVLKEQESRTAELGKELMQRRFKNRKIEIQEAILMKLIKKLGYKTSTDFFSKLAEEAIDINSIADAYLALCEKQAEQSAAVSAGEYVMQTPPEETPSHDNDILEIGTGDGIVKGLNYKLAKCCNPIYGDDVFGFISSEGVVKIHRDDCPNARNIRSRYPYRVIRTRWSGKFDGQMAATLSIIGHDDIGIVTNITSIINKEKSTSLRNISIDSNDGLFQGYVVVGISNTQALNDLIKKIKAIKGVKDVTRSDSVAFKEVSKPAKKK
jgi:GTP pyrophosphokinase